ncbi:MAG: hypothetical protein HYX76_09060 [Acidobacteria bacterium]|nr:hypothetical protein [Acidobacteriota bacterium]
MDAARDHRSLLAAREKQLLVWMAARLPAWIDSDHLTAAGLGALAAAGVGYALSGARPWLLHLVNLALLVNWLGDSLDGTLARVRGHLRPRYGFYVDHLVDTLGTFFVVGGLALSEYMSPMIALGFLVVYFMLAINVYLAAYTLGRFQISFWKLGPTELRILLVVANLQLLNEPSAVWFGRPILLYDIGAAMGIAVMAVMFLVSAASNTAQLYREETRF